MMAYERVLKAFRREGLEVSERSDGRAQAQAPGHSRADRSVSITKIEGSVLVCSHSDPTSQVLDRIGLSLADLYDDRTGATYKYCDGRTVHRTPNKDFKQYGNTKGTALFRVERVVDATRVYVVEGEKDVLACEAAGGFAVCKPMGSSGEPGKFNWSPLENKTVVVVADKDRVGRDYAAKVSVLLRAIAATVEVAEAKSGKDLADHVAAGHQLDELVTIGETRPRIWRATDLAPAEQPRWLAKGRIPYGSLSLLIGDEGIGKSLFWVLVVAHVTTGKPLPGFGIPARDPAKVRVVVTEDNWSSVVRPRLEVAGADMNRIDVICTERDGSGSPVFPRNIDLVVSDPVPSLVVVDTWIDTLPSGLSIRDPQHARQALHPWKDVATSSGAAVLLVVHTNRVASGNARDKYGGTSELRKKARLTLFAQADDEQDGALVIGPEKANSTGKLPASKFVIRSVQYFAASEDDDGTIATLDFVGDTGQTMKDHIADSYDGVGDDNREASAGELWLADYLKEAGRVPGHQVKKDGLKVGFKDHTLKRAARKMGVRYTDEGYPRTTWWSLPVGDDQNTTEDRSPVAVRTVLTVPTIADQRKQIVPTDEGDKSEQSAQHERDAHITVPTTSDKPCLICVRREQVPRSELCSHCQDVYDSVGRGPDQILAALVKVLAACAERPRTRSGPDRISDALRKDDRNLVHYLVDHCLEHGWITRSGVSGRDAYTTTPTGCAHLDVLNAVRGEGNAA